MVNKGVRVVSSLVVAGGLVFVLTRKAAASPDEQGEGTIDIEIIGPDGQPVPQV